MTELTAATKEANDASDEFVNAVRVLRNTPAWHVLRRKIERDIERLKDELLKPASTQEQLLECERSKGAAIALKALFIPFDSKLPEPKGEPDV